MSETTAPVLQDKSIAIVGGGPAGLTLARLLQMQGARVSVYERDASRDVRGQGGSLDMHEDSGQFALARAGLWDRFKAIARPEGQRTAIYDRHGALRAEFTDRDEEQSRPEIDRRDLRDLLLDSLVPGTVLWDRELHAVERSENGRWRLLLAKGDSAEADLLFGCDGGWSKIRSLRSDLQPIYSGVTFVQTWIEEAQMRHPELAALVGHGNIMALGENRGLMAQRNGNGDIRVYVALRLPEHWARNRPYGWTDSEAVRADLLRPFDGWAETILALLRHSDPIFQPWPLYHIAPRQTWRNVAGVTLLGDAAHIMPPFTGRGANLAMLDAVELAERLTAPGLADVDTAIADYETSMLKRMEMAIQETLEAQDRLIAEDAPEPILALIRRHMD
ncbi:FAD-dependent oxidoreductase [Rhizobium sp. A37_96]